MTEIFHVLNRGVDKRKMFLDKQDYFRFIHDLFEFNDQEPISNTSYFFRKNLSSSQDDRLGKKPKKPRKLLVNIFAFCLMPNHYHLLLNPRIENSIPRFMQKLNMGYARYFNERYERKGTLFESRYKSIVVKNEAHFIHLPYYIHLNSLDLKFPDWRNGKLRNYKAAIEFLNNYRWSSHLDYLGKNNFPSITQREFLLESFGGHQEYKQSINHWLRDSNLEDISDFLLE